MKIGHQMKAARMKAGLTQSEASKQIGVSRQTLSHWENEKTYADAAQLLILSQVYGVEVDELLKEDTIIQKPPLTETVCSRYCAWNRVKTH